MTPPSDVRDAERYEKGIPTSGHEHRLLQAGEVRGPRAWSQTRQRRGRDRKGELAISQSAASMMASSASSRENPVSFAISSKVRKSVPKIW